MPSRLRHNIRCHSNDFRIYILRHYLRFHLLLGLELSFYGYSSCDLWEFRSDDWEFVDLEECAIVVLDVAVVDCAQSFACAWADFGGAVDLIFGRHYLRLG